METEISEELKEEVLEKITAENAAKKKAGGPNQPSEASDKPVGAVAQASTSSGAPVLPGTVEGSPTQVSSSTGFGTRGSSDTGFLSQDSRPDSTEMQQRSNPDKYNLIGSAEVMNILGNPDGRSNKIGQ